MQMPNRPSSSRGGFAVVTVLLLTVVLGALLVAMFALTNTEIASSRVNADITSGFYAAEAGLNVRGELIRREFQGYNRPSGTSPEATDACSGLNVGTGDMACQTLDVNDRTVTTYVLEDPRNNDPDDRDRAITVPPGELFAGLSAIQD
jgi:Tfp pilus assembly protein PilX